MRRFGQAVLAAICLACATLTHAQPVEIRYAVMDGADSIGHIRQTVAEFEKQHPNIKVRIEQVTDEYFMRLLTQYAAGVAPDVAQMNVAMVQPFAMRGALVPIDHYVAESPEIDLKQWYPNIVRFFSWDGHLWALPRDVSPFGLIFYNKTLFERAGIKPPDGTWSWSYQPRPELKEKCFTWVMQQMTVKIAKGKTVQFGFAPD